ncbi:unnamed protein product [Adineta steineri]|uniref:Transmembrane protein n=1 Tax=Adineta steineri TaxID=433720 RepID=A0A819RXB4_9BILA|nr:unnamed protein product [Adineta steineri]CAF4047588.1 unnamed protein product [Adineta steineri]
MEATKTQPMSYKFIIIGIIILILLILYATRNTIIEETEVEEPSVSLCHIRYQYDGSYGFDDRTLLILLATLKMHDFIIGQPLWGSSDTLLYLCEHRLKVGLKQTLLDRVLHNVIKNGPSSAGHLTWSCA